MTLNPVLFVERTAFLNEGQIARFAQVIRLRPSLLITSVDDPQAYLRSAMPLALRRRFARAEAIEKLSERPIFGLISGGGPRRVKFGNLGYFIGGGQPSSNIVCCTVPFGFDRRAELALRCLLLEVPLERPRHARHLQSYARFGANLPKAPQVPFDPSWTPRAIITIPSTLAVCEVLARGTLGRRLIIGEERIYLSDWAFALSPRIRVPILSLADRFPRQLVIVRAGGFEWAAIGANTMGAFFASEFYLIGHLLKGAYGDDLDSGMPEPRYRFRVGGWPGNASGWIRELLVATADWDGLGEQERQAIETQNQRALKVREERARAALMTTLKAAIEDDT